MFIEYSQEAIDCCSNDVVIQSLLLASTAMREGNHIVCTCNAKLAQQIVDLTLKSNQSVARSFNKLKESFAQISAVKKYICVYINICAGNQISVSQNENNRIICVGIERTLCSNFWHETLLILENYQDEKPYRILYKACNIHNIMVKWEPVLGGGTTTADVVEKNVNQNKLVLCIADGDVHAPHSDIGETARKIVQKAEGHYLCRIITTNCSEVENLFFDYAILSCFNYDEDVKNQRIFSCLDKARTLKNDILFYYDVKKGHRYKNIKDNDYLLNAFSMNINTCENRRFDDICKNCKDCQCVVVEDMGKNYLSQLLGQKEAESRIIAIFDSLSESLQEEWRRIAQELTSWCCACQINPYQI